MGCSEAIGCRITMGGQSGSIRPKSFISYAIYSHAIVIGRAGSGCQPSDLIGCDIYGGETSHHRVIVSLPIEPVAKASGLAPEDFSKMQKGAGTLRNNLIQAVRDEP